ncbi:MAG: GNAT family N-acetyltransferase [Actinomycetes bacterium]
MTSNATVDLRPVSSDNWRDCAALEVSQEQREFVAPVTRYLTMCAYGDTPWHPLAVESGGSTVGFVMWAVDPADNSLWIGGLVVDAAHQHHGIGRAVVASLVERAQAEGRTCAALSYSPANVVARTLYVSLGFLETGETEDDEVVARLPFV